MPIRRGRSGYYTADHVARLELVQELQSHGFTLSAIEKYVARIPDDASPETIALHRTLLAPWMAELPETMWSVASTLTKPLRMRKEPAEIDPTPAEVQADPAVISAYLGGARGDGERA